MNTNHYNTRPIVHNAEHQCATQKQKTLKNTVNYLNQIISI